MKPSKGQLHVQSRPRAQELSPRFAPCQGWGHPRLALTLDYTPGARITTRCVSLGLGQAGVLEGLHPSSWQPRVRPPGMGCTPLSLVFQKNQPQALIFEVLGPQSLLVGSQARKAPACVLSGGGHGPQYGAGGHAHPHQHVSPRCHQGQARHHRAQRAALGPDPRPAVGATTTTHPPTQDWVSGCMG